MDEAAPNPSLDFPVKFGIGADPVYCRVDFAPQRVAQARLEPVVMGYG